MTRPPHRPRPRSLRQIAGELCRLFQQQIDVLQQGLSTGDLEQYLHRRGQIDELHARLKALRPRPS
jgi:hypothetical protein